MKEQETCIVPNCSNPMLTRGFCDKHYHRWILRKRRGLAIDIESVAVELPRFGKHNGNWRGGRKHQGNGYVLIYKPNHPHSDCWKCVLGHRLVMEEHLGRFLNPEEVVHHKNNKSSDNNIKNLVLFKNQAEHARYHALGNRPSEETRRKIGEARKGIKHPFYGKHHSEESKKKMSEAHKRNIDAIRQAG